MNIDQIFLKNRSDKRISDLLIFFDLSKPHLLRLIAAVLCGAVLAGINGSIAWLVKPALDYFFIHKTTFLLIVLPLGIILLFFMRGAFTFLTNYLMASIGAKIVKTLRKEIYERLIFLPMSFYTKTSSGSVVSKVLNDLGILHSTVAHTIKDFFVEGATVLALAIVALTRCWDLAVLSFIVIPFMGYTIAKFGKLMRSTSLRTRKLISQVTNILNESLVGMKVIKAFNMENIMTKKHDGALTEHYRNTMREVRIDEFSRFMTEVFGGIGVAIIILYGSYLVSSEKLTASSFFSFTTAILMMYTPVRRLSKVYNNFQQGSAVIERIKGIIFEERERSGGIEKALKGHIVFENVSFRYPEANDYALRNLNFEIKEGEIFAIVGLSGAGKSTIIDILAGFWSPTEGKVMIDGININHLSLKSIRASIGMVTQDVILFNDTIRANIICGNPAASEEEMLAAAKAAYVHEFVEEMPEGYDTFIGERGIKLSGGQKQRITIARAILKNPAILILDEATSSLDSEHEQKVQQALDRLMSERTTIIIAHRLSTIKKASRIMVINKGMIEQIGTHEEIFSTSNTYRELYQLQYKEGSYNLEILPTSATTSTKTTTRKASTT
ncbi:MAG: ABC transporter ATP-binding protein/permease [Thermodesulfovibrionales bacterium]|nr:ABC transporter ATP-binding protein/permease [Thermodesulfovibrionales bacterium]